MVVFECSPVSVCVLREEWRVSSHHHIQVNGNMQVYKKGAVGKEGLRKSSVITPKKQ